MQALPITVAIQGDTASFHEIAAKKYYGPSAQFIYCRSFAQTFEALASGWAQYAFVATRNSVHGDIAEVKQLLRKYKPQQEGVHHETIRQHLVARPGAQLSDITEVVSHPVALSQCDTFVREKLSAATIITYHDTAAAIKFVKEHGSRSLAAIGSAEAAQLYGLEIIAADIQTDPQNRTTFVSLLKRD